MIVCASDVSVLIPTFWCFCMVRYCMGGSGKSDYDVRLFHHGYESHPGHERFKKGKVWRSLFRGILATPWLYGKRDKIELYLVSVYIDIK